MGPLAGLKVLDFSTLLPGPYASMLLADMGAEVLRVESADRPDLLRITAPLHQDMSYAHLMINRNKQSLALDLKSEAAGEIIRELLQEYDVLIEQFRPGVMQRLGLDFDSLQQINPRLIYCSITGYGQTGPMAQKAGHDINYLALSGLASYSGTQKAGPVLCATQVADLAGGSQQAVMAILAAVIKRQTTDLGQYLDISMADGALSLNSMFAAASLATGEAPEFESNLLNGGSLYDYYQTSDGRYLAIGSLEPQFLSGLLAATGLELWLPKVAKGQELAELKQALAEVIIGKTLDIWQHKFAELDVCVEPVLTLTEAAEHPQFQARNMFVHVQLEDGSLVRQLAPAVKFEEDYSSVRAGVRPGTDTMAVLAALGFDAQTIANWKRAGAIVG